MNSKQFVYTLQQNAAHLYCQGPKSWYFRLCGPIESLLQLLKFAILVCKQPYMTYKTNRHSYPNKILFIKTGYPLDLALGCNLPIPALELCFSIFTVHTNHMDLNTNSWFRKSGWSLRFCILNTPSVDWWWWWSNNHIFE